MASKNAENNFKIVPEKLEDITASWCQHILHEGSTIDKGVVHQIVSPISNSKTLFMSVWDVIFGRYFGMILRKFVMIFR